MHDVESTFLGRRGFLARAMPACALGCIGLGRSGDLTDWTSGSPPCQVQHKFDRPFPVPLTVRDYFSRQLGTAAQVLKAVRQEMGEEELLRVLHAYAIRRGESQGNRVAQQYPDRSFFSYNERFRSGQMQELLTYEIVEDSDEAFEIEATECVLAEVMQEQDAGRIGNAWLCDVDCGHAQGFNPKIRLVRDKTLMKGDRCCNHRYLWTE